MRASVGFWVAVRVLLGRVRVGQQTLLRCPLWGYFTRPIPRGFLASPPWLPVPSPLPRIPLLLPISLGTAEHSLCYL